jgi:hypothetical protein
MHGQDDEETSDTVEQMQAATSAGGRNARVYMMKHPSNDCLCVLGVCLCVTLLFNTQIHGAEYVYVSVYCRPHRLHFQLMSTTIPDP